MNLYGESFLHPTFYNVDANLYAVFFLFFVLTKLPYDNLGIESTVMLIKYVYNG